MRTIARRDHSTVAKHWNEFHCFNHRAVEHSHSAATGQPLHQADSSGERRAPRHSFGRCDNRQSVFVMTSPPARGVPRSTRGVPASRRSLSCRGPGDCAMITASMPARIKGATILSTISGSGSLSAAEVPGTGRELSVRNAAAIASHPGGAGWLPADVWAPFLVVLLNQLCRPR